MKIRTNVRIPWGTRSASRMPIVAIAMIVALFAAACGTQNETGTDQTEPPATPGEATDQAVDDDGDRWDQVVADAREEGEVLFYAGRIEETVGPLVEAFNEQYPDISIEYLRMSTGEMVQRVESEMQAGDLQADLIWGAAEALFAEWAEEGMFLEPEGPETENWDEADYQNGVVRAVIDPYVIGYNTDSFGDEPPTDWCAPESTLDESLTVGYQEPAIPGHALAYTLMADACGEDGMEARVQQDINVGASAIPLTESLAAGEIDLLLIPGFMWIIEPYIRDGAPVDYVTPSSGSASLESQMVAFAEAPHPNAALVWLDFVMSEEAQRIITEELPAVSVLDGVGEDIDLSQLHPAPVDEAEADALMEEAAEILERLRSG